MSNQLFEISTCEVCDNRELQPALDLGLHPMCDDLVEFDSARRCKEYPIVIEYCAKCNTAHQKYQIPKNELFPKTYHYRSRFTADVLTGMRSLVEDSVELLGSLKDKKVLDIGCNDGSLLSIFIEKGAITFGIEPTDAYKDAQQAGHAAYNEFLTEESAMSIVEKHGKFDIITFTNVFAHIENLPAVIAALKILMHDASVLIIENHYLGAVIDRKQFDTFYHEHPRTYSFTSFQFIAKSLGLNIIKVLFPSRYGGNIRVTMGGNAQPSQQLSELQQIVEKESGYLKELQGLKSEIDEWKSEMKALLQSKFEQYGKLRAKAFPGRAAILVKLLELDENIISAVYEKPGSMKIGHYLPGTRIPIKSDDELFREISTVPVIVNLAWHIKNEIQSYLSEKGFKGELINIL